MMRWLVAPFLLAALSPLCSSQAISITRNTQVLWYWVDPSTGLMWAGKDSGKDVNWKQATKYCRDLRLARYSDWTLATLDELQGIYDKNAAVPGLSGQRDDVPTTWHVKRNLFLTGYLWSGSQILDDRGKPSGYAWRFDFNEGRRFGGDETWFYTFKRALCVRRDSQPAATHLPHVDTGHYGRTFVVEAANHDPAADTPEKIVGVNKSLAAQGHKDAAWQLGLAFMQGYGVPQDLAEAERWFRVGATDPDEKFIMASLYRNGEYFPRNLDKAAEWFEARPAQIFEQAQAYRTMDPPQFANALPFYLWLLKTSGPEVRRAQMELGNLVIDGKYSDGDDASGRTQNLKWARIITQELLGQEESKIAVDYSIGREDLSPDPVMSLRFCKRAAAYNVDGAQLSYAQDIMRGNASNASGYDEIVWLRLASQKHTDALSLLKAAESGMSPEQHRAADAAFAAMMRTRIEDGAYYPAGDPLRGVSAEALAAMPQDDPDVQLREAFAMEKAATTNQDEYLRAMDLYRKVRDRREIDIRMVLARDALNGTRGVPKNEGVARYWLFEAVQRGSAEAKDTLARLDTAAGQ